VETDHDRIGELLAGYVLRSLSGDDAREADRLLAEHVPSCLTCRSTLGDFQAVMGELALGADPVAPPEMLLPRLHREMGFPPRRRRRPVSVVAAAASVVAVVGMAGLAVSQGIRASNADERSALMGEALRFASRPDASTVSLVGPDASGGATAPVIEITAPGVEVVYLICHDVAPPSPGNVYRIWFESGGSFRYVSGLKPELTVLRLQFDPAAVDRILITEEPLDRAPTQPDVAAIRWSDAA
jgi:anti-sigma-K factor RskA